MKLQYRIIIITLFLTKITHNNSLQAFSFDYFKSTKEKLTNLYRPWFAQKKQIPQIALMSIEGNIETAKIMLNQLFIAAKNPNIKGLIIHIESCGGTIATSQLIFNEIKKLKKIKPVVVIVENYCLSSAYQIAVAADYIFALPSSELGGIGVVTTVKKYKDLKFKENQTSGSLDVWVHQTGNYKDLGNPHTPLKQEDIDWFKEKAKKKYDNFVAAIAQARNLSIDDEKQWADGQVFVGTDALLLGLIDALGDFTDTINKIKELIQQKYGIDKESKFELFELNTGKRFPLP